LELAIATCFEQKKPTVLFAAAIFKTIYFLKMKRKSIGEKQLLLAAVFTVTDGRDHYVTHSEIVLRGLVGIVEMFKTNVFFSGCFL